MLAAIFHQFGPPSVLSWEDVPDPSPGPGEVMVAVQACGLNHIDLDYERLRMLKRRYDPANLFCYNQNMVP